MKKQFINPSLNILAMLLVIASRKSFDLFAIAASIVLILSIISIIAEFNKLK